jgi:hypothetical protein
MTYNINFLRRDKIEISDALHTLCPGSSWSVDDTYDSIENFKSDDYDLPSENEINAEIERLQAIADSYQYQRLRVKEYPNVKDYLDGIVKGDQEQIQSYIDKCNAVKAKYPKPEVTEE